MLCTGKSMTCRLIPVVGTVVVSEVEWAVVENNIPCRHMRGRIGWQIAHQDLQERPIERHRLRVEKGTHPGSESTIPSPTYSTSTPSSSGPRAPKHPKHQPS